jgi:hypothetical protein
MKSEKLSIIISNKTRNLLYEEGVLPSFRAVGHDVAWCLAPHSAVAGRQLEAHQKCRPEHSEE